MFLPPGATCRCRSWRLTPLSRPAFRSAPEVPRGGYQAAVVPRAEGGWRLSSLVLLWPHLPTADTPEVAVTEAKEGLSVSQTARSSRRLEWAKVLVVPFSIALLPLAFAAWEGAQSRALTTDQLDSEYVAIAISILSQPTVGEEASQRQKDADKALRQWSVDVLGVTSPVELTSELRIALLQGDVSLAEYESAIERFRSIFEIRSQASEVLSQRVPQWSTLNDDQRSDLLNEYLAARALLSQQRTDWSSLTAEQQSELVLGEMGIT